MSDYTIVHGTPKELRQQIRDFRSSGWKFLGRSYYLGIHPTTDKYTFAQTLFRDDRTDLDYSDSLSYNLCRDIEGTDIIESNIIGYMEAFKRKAQLYISDSEREIYLIVQ